jgi:hypothetical protein
MLSPRARMLLPRLLPCAEMGSIPGIDRRLIIDAARDVAMRGMHLPVLQARRATEFRVYALQRFGKAALKLIG